jgi:hypothetical protein
MKNKSEFLPSSVQPFFLVAFCQPDIHRRKAISDGPPSQDSLRWLHFLLNRRYRYPPDQISVDLNLRNLGKAVVINYDPFAVDPDYLVVGSFSHGSELYAPVLTNGTFRLLHRYKGYDLYERVRQ